MGKLNYDSFYSKALPKNNDLLINRNILFKKTLYYLKIKPNDIILEVGCDKGYFVKFLQQITNAFGIDLNKEVISLADCNNLFVRDATNTRFPDNYFTKIYSFHTIEHIPDLRKFFNEIDRILKKNGIVVLAYPCEIFRGMCSLRQALKVYKNPFIARKLHIHKLNPKKIKKYLKGTSLKHIKSELLFALLPQYLTVLKKSF